MGRWPSRPMARILATGSDDSEPDPSIKLRDPATGRLIRDWDGGEGTVSSLAFAPAGGLLASGHLASSRNVRIWDVTTGRPQATVEGHTDQVRAVAFAPGGRMLASASSDGAVALWDVDTWRLRQVLRYHGDTVHAVTCAAQTDVRSRRPAAGDTIRLWSLLPDGGTFLTGAVHNPDQPNGGKRPTRRSGRLIAAADTLGSIAIWDPPEVQAAAAHPRRRRRAASARVRARRQGLCRRGYDKTRSTSGTPSPGRSSSAWPPTERRSTGWRSHRTARSWRRRPTMDPCASFAPSRDGSGGSGQTPGWNPRRSFGPPSFARSARVSRSRTIIGRETKRVSFGLEKRALA